MAKYHSILKQMTFLLYKDMKYSQNGFIKIKNNHCRDKMAVYPRLC